MDRIHVPSDREPQFIAPIDFAPAFTVTLQYDVEHRTVTPHGERIFRKIRGGTVTGRIEGTVYPNGAGEYSIAHEDGVIDIDGHILLRDAQGEWLYLRNIGYSRPDGYARVTSWVDADVRGNHIWALGLFFIGSISEARDGGSATITYCEVL